MCEEGLVLDIPEVVEKIKKWGLSSNTWISKMLKMVQRHDISVDVINKIPIRKDGRKKRDQTSKYTTLENVAYYMHHDWYKNHKVR